MQSTPFVTDITSLPHTTSYKELNTYLNNIKSKLSYADFKQQITLLQNYQPLSKIIKRTKVLKQEHQQKFKQDQGLYDWYQEQKKDTQQYLKKLESQLINLTQQIQVTNWKKQQLKTEMEERRKVLKEILNGNKQMLYKFLDNKMMPKSVEISLDQKRRAMSYNSIKNLQKVNIRSRKSSSHTQQSHKIISNPLISLKRKKSSRSIKSSRSNSSNNQNKYLFQECLLNLSKSIKSNTSSNIQSGIFLDILQATKQQQEMKLRNIEANNLVYQVLLNSYREAERKSNQQNQEKIIIQWDTFKKFNGKQVFGLLMVKDKGMEIIRGLCKNWS